MSRKLKKEGQECPAALGKRDVGGFTEGSSPGEVELEATQEGRGWGQ